ncbi:Nucleotidyltransferase domain containing protein [Tritrichomonas foetus]|uniref:Nucleotidyltransferase domain containing protein n=1 Tax=Tritrichomonas foetus TaxID=1144522 RepID=A0A1J4KQX8_9EUKA|nr:Nucleotidyltransferase domain containing protein [Tritrichomonas foetus]|eukprot:OHT12204.1 Nucleotidyltransferase domain containing protein [Tritrichomonas foetus]
MNDAHVKEKLMNTFPRSFISGPWTPEGKVYNDEDPYDRLDCELNDLFNWLVPTQAENFLRKSTIIRYTNFIETIIPNSRVVVQGSSATDTFLTNSDIDLIVFIDKISKQANKLSTDKNKNEKIFRTRPVFDSNYDLTILTQILNELTRARMINDGKLIKSARVPIVKARDRYFGFEIDICIGNFNGVVSTKRVMNYLDYYKNNHNDLLKKLLFILKIYIHGHKIDSPFEGGFGSTELVHFSLFVILKNPSETSLSKLLIYFFDLIGNKLNFFLAGLSLEKFPHFISKLNNDVLIKESPQSLVFQDSANHENFLGTRSRKTLLLSSLCRFALSSLQLNKSSEKSYVCSFMPSLANFIELRNKHEQYYQILIDNQKQEHIEEILDRNGENFTLVENIWQKSTNTGVTMNFFSISETAMKKIIKNQNDQKTKFPDKQPPYKR